MDIFGVVPKLFIDNSEKFKTKHGGFLTILLCIKLYININFF